MVGRKRTLRRNLLQNRKVGSGPEDAQNAVADPVRSKRPRKKSALGKDDRGSGEEFALNRNVKRPYVTAMKQRCDKLGMRFYVSNAFQRTLPKRLLLRSAGRLELFARPMVRGVDDREKERKGLF